MEMMTKRRRLKIGDISLKGDEQLTEIRPEEILPLPAPYEKTEIPLIEGPSADVLTQSFVCNLDGFVALNVPVDRSETEQAKDIDLFARGLKKLLTVGDNWTFLQPLHLSLEYCAQCQSCSESCPVFVSSGRNDLYRPTYRSEIVRRLIGKTTKVGRKVWAKVTGRDIDLNWTTLSRLYELSYRCTLCRRCAQACPMGVDNALITRELRKVFSQELGWAPYELHEKGTMVHLQTGSTSGMIPRVARDNLEFIDDDFTEVTGVQVATPWDVEGADVLFLPGAGEILAWPESIAAFTILCHAAGIGFTLSSEKMGYDGVNYGLFYNDVQFAKIATRHAQVARKLNVRKIVMGECGHEHKALMAVSDRLLTGDLDVHRESIMTFLEHIVFSGKIAFDPSKNDFPVTLHDPCNIVRNLGIVEPQRRILRYLCPQFREMTPHGINNYCCGGGGGLVLLSENNFLDWRANVAGRQKLLQVLEAFADCPDVDIPKYVCAPCLNCKNQFRDIFAYHRVKEKSNIHYGGLIELIANAMVDIREPFIRWEEH
jgi:Fe-S oxidoreductase